MVVIITIHENISICWNLLLFRMHSGLGLPSRTEWRSIATDLCSHVFGENGILGFLWKLKLLHSLLVMKASCGVAFWYYILWIFSVRYSVEIDETVLLIFHICDVYICTLQMMGATYAWCNILLLFALFNISEGKPKSSTSRVFKPKA